MKPIIIVSSLVMWSVMACAENAPQQTFYSRSEAECVRLGGRATPEILALPEIPDGMRFTDRTQEIARWKCDMPSRGIQPPKGGRKGKG